MDLQAPIAGPSRPRPAPSFDRYSSRSDPPSSSSRSSTPSLHRKSSSIFGDGFSTPTPSSHTRYSTPSLNGGSSTPVFYPNGARFRSQSVLSTSQREDELINKKRLDSFRKLKSSWDLLKEKYGSISLEDDDEIDLRTGKVVKDRGRLRDYVGREFGEIPISDNETQTDGDGESKGEGGYEIDSDEDEIGLWDERSGLDPQITEPPLLWEMENNLRRTKSWVSVEDEDDLKEFLSLEAHRNRLLGVDNTVSEDEGSFGAELSDRDSVDRWEDSRFRGTRILPVSATLDDLFNSDGEMDTSVDELQLIDDEGEPDQDVRVHSIVAPNDDPSVDTNPQSPSPPPPQRRGKTLEVEVVIPIRSRRKSLPAPSITKSGSTLSPASEGLNRSTKVKTTFSAPSLSGLFNSPPPDDDLCSRSPSWSPLRSPSPADPSPSPTHDGHDRHSAIVFSLSPPPTRVLAHLPSPSLATPRPHVNSLSRSAKGKERMAGERPNESLSSTPNSSESPYYTRLWKTPSGVVKLCKRCRKAGGERAEKAPLCKGRVDLAKCTFEGHAVNLGETSQPDGDDEPVQQRALLPDKGRPIHNAEGDREYILSEHDTTINTLKQRSSGEKQRRSHKRCIACKKAGGERAQKAQTCPGGLKRRWCRWYEEESIEVTDELPIADLQSNTCARSRTSILPDIPPHTTDSSDTDDGPLKLRKSGSRRKSLILTSDSEAETIPQRSIPRMSSTPFRTPNRASSEFIGTPSDRPSDLDQSLYASGLIYRSNGRARYCGACYEAGEPRAERAWWCKGRAWGKFCHFLKNNVESDYECPTGSPIKKSSRGVNSGRRTPEMLVRSSSVTRTKRKRVVSTDISQLPSTPSPALGQIVTNTSYMPSPPPTSSVEPYSPNPNTSVTTVRPVTERASSSFSMPPSSPPISDGRPVHPTPSPSLSAAPVDESPIVQRISKPYMSISTQTTGFGPTPPPSIDGARSSSILSDDLPLTLPRKSILRKPSESPYSTSSASGSGSVKRARFSLQPRSPVREESSDPLHHDQTSEDELSIHNNTFEYSSSPSSPATCFSRYSIPSSSPLRNEWTVRAEDIGMKLGPEHTGSLPEGMIKALAPSMARSSPRTVTLGSSVLVNNTFSLPTPPTSSSSTASISMTNRASTSSPALSGGRRRTPPSNGGAETGLMLPPPVPLKRSTPAPTSISSDSGSTPSTSIGPSSIPSPPMDQPIRCTSLHRSSLSSRSRSRSMSDQPSPLSRLSTPSHKASSREVSSTSRKKSRVEMELARKALELGDDAGLEWGLDEDTEDGGRMWREGSVALLRSEL
ncbi:hypothetical protein I203_100134 [Kwoniella mangroviensis CBS 8507]|uniref:uncharacterized protein n=1 Tax=Kwoniella mangroviensis CBS 8507 TaxID=1296122 RepID=UPI00080D7021|nr:uncharacterized protein I203_07905 [Kwoniella mangroviensis CBS 8507]OCF62926.1 hypothetical protein I203_07905 [Kwoniella mangroviensis CBS 8507]